MIVIEKRRANATDPLLPSDIHTHPHRTLAVHEKGVKNTIRKHHYGPVCGVNANLYASETRLCWRHFWSVKKRHTQKRFLCRLDTV